MMAQDRIDAIIQSVKEDLSASGLISQPAGSVISDSQAPSTPVAPKSQETQSATLADFSVDVRDITETRHGPGIRNPIDAEGLTALMNTTTARIGLGRAGPRYPTNAWLLFLADHSVTQDALLRDVDEKLLAELGLFSVQTKVTEGKREYLLRPDLGRQLNDDAKRIISEKCVKRPQVQVCIGDGLSAKAIEVNLRQILPVIQQGCQAAGLSLGTPFFVKYCRVGVMNDIGDLINPEILILLIGERPGLGRADSMSLYMGYHPQSGHTDAERDVICNVFDNGGTNPLEAGAYAVQLAQKMMCYQASGVKLRLAESS